MPFEFRETPFKGLKIIKPHIFSDERGLYIKYYSSDIFAANSISNDFTEFSEIVAKKGSLRGLHFQLNPYSQAKLVRCVVGRYMYQFETKLFGALCKIARSNGICQVCILEVILRLFHSGICCTVYYNIKMLTSEKASCCLNV